MSKNYCREFYSVIRTEHSEPNSSEGKILKLYWILGKCVETLRVIQNPITPKGKQEDKMRELKSMVSDIAVALTNEDIFFRSEVDYMMEKAQDFHQSKTNETKNEVDKIKEKVGEFLDSKEFKAGMSYINGFIEEIKRKSRK